MRSKKDSEEYIMSNYSPKLKILKYIPTKTKFNHSFYCWQLKDQCKNCLKFKKCNIMK